MLKCNNCRIELNNKNEEYENIIGRVASDFHERYIKNPNNESPTGIEIAVEYTTFVLSRFAKLVGDFENAQGQNN
jgi:hypothetical protein